MWIGVNALYDILHEYDEDRVSNKHRGHDVAIGCNYREKVAVAPQEIII